MNPGRSKPQGRAALRNVTAKCGWTGLVAAGGILLTVFGSSGSHPASEAAREASSQRPTDSEVAAAVATGSPARPAPDVWRRSPDFAPPFPQRQELFVPPDQTIAAKTVRQVGGAEVALKGFVDFEGRCAVLEINGSIVCLREGQEQHGIAVIAVDPPQVTLQYQGRQWTETLLRASSAGAAPHSAT
ncbi:MAG: hypothetical protein HUU20_25855 [Pirellulales bacterium]|nr:hypothetical protein [Pirellulales bacterium]